MQWTLRDLRSQFHSDCHLNFIVLSDRSVAQLCSVTEAKSSIRCLSGAEDNNGNATLRDLRSQFHSDFHLNFIVLSVRRTMTEPHEARCLSGAEDNNCNATLLLSSNPEACCLSGAEDNIFNPF